LSIRVELVSGRGEAYWPRPGRVFAAARSHSFTHLAEAIDLAFARWDLAHLQMFTLADETGVSRMEPWDGDVPEGTVDGDTTSFCRRWSASEPCPVIVRACGVTVQVVLLGKAALSGRSCSGRPDRSRSGR
jgi:hypothetical protein